MSPFPPFRSFDTTGQHERRKKTKCKSCSPVSLVSWKIKRMLKENRHTLEALAVNDRRTALVVLLLGDPHLLEGGQRGQNGTTNPHRVFTLRRSNNLDLHRRGSKGSDFLLHTVGDTGVHGGTTRLKEEEKKMSTHLKKDGMSR